MHGAALAALAHARRVGRANFVDQVTLLVVVAEVEPGQQVAVAKDGAIGPGAEDGLEVERARAGAG
jgi:hypothetical protein